MESRVLGGRRLTSVAAVHRYMDATTAASVGGMVEATETPRQQELAANRKAKQLAERLRS